MKNIIKFSLVLAYLYSSSQALGSDPKNVAKKTMMNNGHFLVQCQDGTIEGNVSPYEYFSGQVCPSETKKDIPVAKFLGLRASGSCHPNTFDPSNSMRFRFSKPYFGVSHGDEDSSSSCFIVLKYNLPAGVNIVFNKVRVVFAESVLSDESNARVEISGEGDARIKEKITNQQGKSTIDYTFNTPSSTPCYTRPNATTRINLYAAVFSGTLAKKDKVRISEISVPDFKVVKCGQ